MKRAVKVHGHRTKEELANRADNKALTAGLPVRPQGLNRNLRNWWSKLVVELAGRLTPDDGDALLALAQAKAAKDSATADVLLARFMARPAPERPPLPAPVAPQPSAAPAPPVSAPDCAAAAKCYAVDVISGVVVAGKLVRQAAQRFLDDLEHGPARGITFDPAAAQHVVDYLSRLALGTLMPWQIFVLANLYGFKRANGLRRFRLAYIEVAKKSGKSSMLAAQSLYHADPEGDGEPRAGVYMAATTRYQSASICFKEALRLRAASPDLVERSAAFKGAISFGDSTLEVLASNSEKLNGLNISFGILDELGDHPTPDLFNVFNSSSVSRPQPLVIGITTAGNSRENIAWYQRQRALQALDTTAPDDAFFAFIATLDEGDDPFDEAVWPKSNVSLGVTVGIENIRDAAATAKAIPSTKHSWLRFNMNVWPSVTVSSWIDANDLLKVGNAAISEEELKLSAGERIRNAEQRLAGRPCVAGLDLAIVGDLSALALIFPPLEEDGIFECLFRVWCPEDDIVRRSREQRVPYQSWRDQGFLIATPGETTDFKFIRQEILALRDKFHISELGFDIHLADDLAADLRHEGMEVTQVGQGFHLDPAIRRIEKLIKQDKFCMHGAPPAAWCFTNVALDHGTRDVRLDKKKAREKIDAAAAACTAMFAFLKTPPKPANPYLTRGIIFLDNRPEKFIDEDPDNA
jgi:phage terminase large subunit-like protein